MGRPSLNKMSEYNCNVCAKTFDEFVLFEGHFTFNVKCRTQCGSFMQCYICPENFCHFAELKYHLQSHRFISNQITISNDKLQREYRCHVCNANCYNKGQLERHVKVHEYGNVKCDVCNIRFTRISLSSHIRQFHQKLEKKFRVPVTAQKHHLQIRAYSRDKKDRSSDQLRGYRCHVCKVNCYNKAQLEKHVNVHKDGKLKCEVCNIRFTQISLLCHIRKFHPRLHQKRPQTYPCKFCNLEFSLRARMMSHLNVHYSGNLKCEICKIKFTQNGLTRHNRLAHPELQANSIPPAYNIKKNTTPVNARPNEDIHHCPICKGKFTNHNSMMRHSKMHSFGTLECGVCKIRFTKNGLTRHRRLRHHESPNVPTTSEQIEKPQQTGEDNKEDTPNLGNEDITSYQCNICKTFYSSEDQLEQHEKCHSGPYKCEICSISFTKQTLWRHLKQAHPTFKKQDILKYSCRLCQIEYLNPKKLEKHMKVHSEIELQCEISLTKISSPNHETLLHMDLPQERNISNTPEEVPAEKHPVSIQPSTSTKISDDQNESIEAEADEQYKVEDIISHMKMEGRMLYLVRWAGLEPDDDTWEESSTLDKCPNFLKRLAIYTDKITFNCNLQRLTEACTFQCYLCKKHFSTLTDLSSHKNKHSLYQQWIDPSNVLLSKWTIERSRENSIDFGPQSKISIAADQSGNQLLEQDIDELKRDIDTKEYKQIDDVCINSNFQTPNERDNSPIEADSNMDRDLVEVECKHIDNSDSNFRHSNEEQDNFPIEADSNVSSTVPFDSDLVDGECHPTLEVSDDEECEQTSILERTAPRDEEVFDVSSESEDEVEVIYDDNVDVYYCYFCEEKYYSLKDFGIHVKMCSTVNN